MAGVSPGYISKLKNNTTLIPSEEVVFKIAHAFGNNGLEENEIQELLFFLIKDPKYIKKIESLNFDIKFESKEQMVIIRYLSFIKYEIEKLEDSRKRMEKLYIENKIISKKKSDDVLLIEDVNLNHPIFDIEWLLKQEKYNLFYGRDFNINNGEFYNVIDAEDKKLISNLIRTYFKSNYNKVDDVYIKSMNELNNALNNANVKEGND
ncbi:helix-turn-helix domain-containing protein [Staphylococcus gallinarum]|uniref:helix-turn-helix transcriptional regulator n=1 Tax=Staphylococcus gallinarum TaxID=1293 RepID=UPI002DB59241|nr:helix-turn-helix transcriptional regulator [Staphylococcus gallinarum]MEB6241871.1 helix-turn-helix domain-containing protein [Staphylococcus gallinarum]MEB6295047.1 helix-turn-helix domain-containing protein [Staphylococcus gallinarum]